MTAFAPSLKLLSHPETVRAFMEDDWRAPPIGVEISPTNSCNAKCPWCWFVTSDYKQKHSKEEMDIDTLRNLLNDAMCMGVKAITWTGGGDPSTYSNIDAAIIHAEENQLRQGMFTNGYKAIKYAQYLDWIRITVTEKFTITKHVAEYAKKTKVGVNFNLTNQNVGYLQKMMQDARNAGCVYFQVRPALADRWDLQEEVDYPDWLKSYDTDTFKVILTGYKFEDYRSPHGYPTCHGHRIVPFVWHNGDVSTCAYHFGREPFILGNLRDGGFKAVWHGERRRKMLADGVPVIRECQHACKLHECNKVLAAMRNEYPLEDGEFP